MGTQEVIDYVMNSPHNTNRAVLESMLDSIESGGGAEEGVLLYEGDHEISSTATAIYFEAQTSLCLPDGYERSLYKVYFGDDIQYCYVSSVGTSSLDGTEMNVYTTKYPYVVRVFGEPSGSRYYLTKMYLNIMGPSTQMHIKIYQVA